MEKKPLITSLKKPDSPLSVKAYAVVHREGLQYETLELDIVEGVVKAVNVLTRAPDVPAIAVSKATRGLWASMKQKADDNV